MLPPKRTRLDSVTPVEVSPGYLTSRDGTRSPRAPDTEKGLDYGEGGDGDNGVSVHSRLPGPGGVWG